jgi:hypothetical protein
MSVAKIARNNSCKLQESIISKKVKLFRTFSAAFERFDRNYSKVNLIFSSFSKKALENSISDNL